MRNKFFRRGLMVVLSGAVLTGLVFSAGILSAEVIYTPEGVIVTHYPEQFDLIGQIDRIDKDGLVIHDRFFAFSPQTRFMTPHQLMGRAGDFAVGQEVGLVHDQHNHIITVALIYRYGSEPDR